MILNARAIRSKSGIAGFSERGTAAGSRRMFKRGSGRPKGLPAGTGTRREQRTPPRVIHTASYAVCGPPDKEIMGSMEELPHDFARAGNDRWHQIERV